MPMNRDNRDETFIGRIREDISCPKGLAFWCVSDKLRNGAATNAVQIAELLVREAKCQGGRAGQGARGNGGARGEGCNAMRKRLRIAGAVFVTIAILYGVYRYYFPFGIAHRCDKQLWFALRESTLKRMEADFRRAKPRWRHP